MKQATRSPFDFVLDCSVTMAWCFEDESNPYSEKILDCLTEKNAVVPTIWPLEVANVLLVAEKRKRLNTLDAAAFVEALSGVSICVDDAATYRATTTVLSLARQTGLTVYEAAYLEIALREHIPIATLDKALIRAAKQLKLQVQK